MFQGWFIGDKLKFDGKNLTCMFHIVVTAVAMRAYMYTHFEYKSVCLCVWKE